MKYEWGEDKNRQNQRKHHVSFELAALAFEDHRALIYFDRIDETSGEARWHAVGAVQIETEPPALLLVVHVYRKDRYGQEIIRIISARQAEKNDVRRYQEQKVD